MLTSILCFFTGSAQVKYAFTKDTVEIRGGETFANMLKVYNPYAGTVVLRQDSRNKLTKGLIQLPDTIILKGGETRMFPVKYIADRQTLNRNLQSFGLRLTSADPAVKVQQAALFYAQLTDVGGLTIGTEEDEVYLSQLTNQVQVVVRCANNGFIPITFRLQLNGIPDGLEFTGQTINVTLQPGAQQLFPFLARNKGGARTPPEYTVTIRAVDGSNNELATKLLRIVNVTNATRMGLAANRYTGVLPNTVSLRYVSQAANSSYLQLQGNGNVNLGEDKKLSYSVNADRFDQPGYKGLNVYNTYLSYQTKSWGVKAGNIYENTDFILGGRGLKISRNFSNHAALSVYGMENNFMLINQFPQQTSPAKIFAVDYNLERGGKGDRRLLYAHSSDSFTGLKVDQLSAKANFALHNGDILGFEAGASLEEQQQLAAGPKKGFGGGLSYLMDNETYQFSGDGYYSTPYFTGLRRGLLYTDARLTRKFSNENTLAGHVMVQENSPKYQNELNLDANRSLNKTSVYIYELAYGIKAGSFRIGFGPYYMNQRLIGKSFVDVPPMDVDWKSASFRFMASLNYNSAIQNFSLTADYGYTFMNTSARPPAPFNSLKINANYNLYFFGLTSYIQLNPYYLTDGLSSSSGNRYNLYSFGPNIHFTGLKNALTLQFAGMYNHYGFTNTSGYSGTGNARWQLKGNWALTADLQYTLSKQRVNSMMYVDNLNMARAGRENLYLDNRQFRLGVEKQFGHGPQGATHKLELTYYEDRNNNGARDADEAAIPGVLVKINNEAALTNSKGTVAFRNMNKEAYTAAVTNTKGWSLQEPTTVFVDKNKHLDIPLVKTQALNGCLKLKVSRYIDNPPVLAGIRINAVDHNGRVHQTLTDDNGSFCFYLPRNKYTVYIETEGLPFSIENGREEVLLEGLPVQMLTFVYKDERRKVGVTRF